MIPRKLIIDKGIYWSQGINLVDGCSKISAACENCWAEAQAKIYAQKYLALPQEKGGYNWFGAIQTRPERLTRFNTKKSQVFSVWNDLFQSEVPDKFIANTFDAMAANPQHTYLVCTKRPERMVNFFIVPDKFGDCAFRRWGGLELSDIENLWLGTTVENQENVKRLSCLEIIETASKKFCSFEPLLGPLNFEDLQPAIDWAIVGCQTGHNPRLCGIGDMIDLVGGLKQCDIPIFVKAVPINGKPCKDISKFPKELQYRELPF